MNLHLPTKSTGWGVRDITRDTGRNGVCVGRVYVQGGESLVYDGYPERVKTGKRSRSIWDLDTGKYLGFRYHPLGILTLCSGCNVQPIRPPEHSRPPYGSTTS